MATTRTMKFICPECDDVLRGEPGATGMCAGCFNWIDVPEFCDTCESTFHETALHGTKEAA